MIELLTVIALLCQVNGADSSAARTIKEQRVCQKELIDCMLSKKHIDKIATSALFLCVREYELRSNNELRDN